MRTESGHLIPVERKKTLAPRRGPYDGDLIQAAVYCMLVEEEPATSQTGSPTQSTPCVPKGIKIPQSLINILNGPKSPVSAPPPCPAQPPKNSPAPAPVTPTAPVPSLPAVPASPATGAKWVPGSKDITIDTVAASTTGGTVVYLGHRPDANGSTEQAVFSGARVVVTSADTLDGGRILVRLLRDGLGVLPTGQVTWRGEYANSLGEAVRGQTHTGGFIERKLVEPDNAPDKPTAASPVATP